MKNQMISTVNEAVMNFKKNGFEVKQQNVYLCEYRIFSGFLTDQQNNKMFFLLWQGFDSKGNKHYLRADNGEILDIKELSEAVKKNNSLREEFSLLVGSGHVFLFPDGTKYTISRKIEEIKKGGKPFLWEGLSSVLTSEKDYKKLVVPAA